MGLKIKYLHNTLYPVLCPKLTLIQPTWSAFPYHLVLVKKNKKTSDTALLSVIALTTFNCIVRASVTKGARSFVLS